MEMVTIRISLETEDPIARFADEFLLWRSALAACRRSGFERDGDHLLQFDLIDGRKKQIDDLRRTDADALLLEELALGSPGLRGVLVVQINAH